MRTEINRYGRETCGEKFNEQQMQKMQFIQNQRSSGLGGFMRKGLEERIGARKAETVESREGEGRGERGREGAR